MSVGGTQREHLHDQTTHLCLAPMRSLCDPPTLNHHPQLRHHARSRPTRINPILRVGGALRSPVRISVWMRMIARSCDGARLPGGAPEFD